MLYTRAFLVLFASLVSTVHGHGAIVAVTGANGVSSTAMGIDASTPRDGTRRRPFQQDSSIIRDAEIQSGEASPCGRTLLGGVNQIASNVEEASSAGLPAMSANGQITMTLHQVNGDGAGPYTCEMSSDATGTDFVPATVITNVPGTNSRSRARAQDFPLVVQAAPGTTCTGGPNGDACIVRCRNAARAGPFGGCAVVTNPEAPAAAAPAPAVSSPVAAAPVAEAPAASSPVAEAPVVSSPVAEAPAVSSPVAEAPEAVSSPVAAAAGTRKAGTQKVVARATEEDDEEEEDHEEPEDFDEMKKREVVEEPIAKRAAPETFHRKRMFPSRIVAKAKRHLWI
jgi:hypothetical protein